MLEKSDLPDERIVVCLRESWGLQVRELAFLPWGYDSNAAVYRVASADGQVLFLKVRKGEVNEASLAVPHHLEARGISQVVAPLPTLDGSLWRPVADFALILYPFIQGRLGAEVGLSDAQWVELGALLRRIHAVDLPAALAGQLKRESFVPKWAEGVKLLARRLRQDEIPDPYARALIRFWRDREQEVDLLVSRAEALGRLLQKQPARMVLCHADIHTFNVLVDDRGRLYVIDWDETQVAPKERDLMFVVDASVGGLATGKEAEELFLRGYGDAEIDWLALAYYRYEWVVQELGEFGALVLSRDDAGASMREAGLRGFMGIFEPGNVVEGAYRSELMLPAALRAGAHRQGAQI